MFAAETTGFALKGPLRGEKLNDRKPDRYVPVKQRKDEEGCEF